MSETIVVFTPDELADLRRIISDPDLPTESYVQRRVINGWRRLVVVDDPDAA